MKLFGREIHWNGKKPEAQFTVYLTEISNLKTHVAKQPCPSCSQVNTLHIVSDETGSKGWEFKAICEKCHASGIFNHTGFHVDFTLRQPT